MRLLFDENMPSVLSHELVGHECTSVMRLSWRGAENGTLLKHAEQAGFDVILTLDDMRSEQNMEGRRIAILILKPAKQGKAAMRALAGKVLLALGTIKPGEIRTVDHKDDA